MGCPYFREGYFGICVAPDAIHVPSIAEMETLCFKTRYAACPNFTDAAVLSGTGDNLPLPRTGAALTEKSRQ
jgi:hypothetical protein